MKHLYIYIACLFVTFAAQAEKSPKAAASKMMASKGSLQLKFQTTTAETVKDSVLVIFDRFDHTGAGVVFQVFYRNSDHSITIPAIPEGKYYVTIQCLGVHRERIETIVKIKSQKSEILKIAQTDSEEFSKDKVVIPAYHPDFANLASARTK